MGVIFQVQILDTDSFLTSNLIMYAPGKRTEQSIASLYNPFSLCFGAITFTTPYTELYKVMATMASSSNLYSMLSVVDTGLGQ